MTTLLTTQVQNCQCRTVIQPWSIIHGRHNIRIHVYNFCQTLPVKYTVTQYTNLVAGTKVGKVSERDSVIQNTQKVRKNTLNQLLS